MRINYRNQFIVTCFSVCLIITVMTPRIYSKNAFSLYLENDSRGLKPNHNTDRHYTHGTKLLFVTQPGWQWLDDFSKWDFGGDESVDKAAGLFLGQNIYTPDNIGYSPQDNPGDMTYAGWLYGGLFAQRATKDILDHIELSIGVIGPSSLAEHSQKKIHEWLDGTRPAGWDTQLDDEPAIDFTYMRQNRLTGGIFVPTEYTDFIAEYGFTAGSVNRFAQAGMTFRCGFNLGDTFGPDRFAMPAGISKLRNTDHSGFIFARLSGRAVEYNRFLTGLNHEPLMGELQVGVVYRKSCFEIGYSQTFFTRQFEHQNGTDSFGALTLTCTF